MTDNNVRIHLEPTPRHMRYIANATQQKNIKKISQWQSQIVWAGLMFFFFRADCRLIPSKQREHRKLCSLQFFGVDFFVAYFTGVHYLFAPLWSNMRLLVFFAFKRFFFFFASVWIVFSCYCCCRSNRFACHFGIELLLFRVSCLSLHIRMHIMCLCLVLHAYIFLFKCLLFFIYRFAPDHNVYDRLRIHHAHKMSQTTIDCKMVFGSLSVDWR